MSEKGLKQIRGGRIVLVVALIVALVLLGGRAVSGFYVDVLWFRTTGFSSVFWTQLLWLWGIRIVAGVLTFVVIFLNLRIVTSTLGSIQIRRQFGNLEISERIPKSYLFWGASLIAGIMALWFGASLPLGTGLRTLFFLNASTWGIADPILGRDVSFFVFTLPILQGALAFVLSLAFIVLALSAAGYATTGSLSFLKGRLSITRAPRLHLTVILATLLFLLALRFWIGRYLLMLNGNSGVQGIVGFADIGARLPGLQAMAAITLAASGVLLWAGIKNRGTLAMASLVSVILGGLILVQLYPELIQRFRVEPNELERESPYIEHNLAFTRTGFGLDGLERRRFEYEQGEGVDWSFAARQFEGLPVWTRSALLTTYRSLEARFRYYDFADVVIDRYPTESGRVPLALSVREINPGGIEDPNWQNLHLRERYLAGMGAVASDAAASTPEGRPPMFLSAIPPEFTPGPRASAELDLVRPSTFFGYRTQFHAVINPGAEAFLAPDGGAGVAGIDFPEGILMDSPLKTLALAWRFRDLDLLFAAEVSSTSRFVFRRQVLERVQTIAPFLRFADPPYPVAFEGRIVWVLDAVTATRRFPISSVYDLPDRTPVTYVRNSVKVTVDGVSGDVRFYSLDGSDPLLATYERAFPELFSPIEEMPTGLQAHLRYPVGLLEIQARVLLQYHQETAPVFHGQQDVWALPQELERGTRPVAYRPEYGLYRLPGDEEAGFLLTTVFVPAGRQNLTAVLAARCDPEGYGELVLLDIPVEDQVPGPRQVEALVEQDPSISQQFSLWRQGGSQVWSGHLHLVPVGRTLLYMEPVFLAAEEDAIPELRRYVVSDGSRVSMMPTLQEAIRELAQASGAELLRMSDPEALPVPGQEEWPREALQLLEEADRRLREGDWQGFGESLAELRSLLERLNRGGAGPAP